MLVGLSCCVTTSASGELVVVQLNWKGATNACHARTDKQHPKLHQDHQPNSHFQNEDTFARYLERLGQHAAHLKVQLGFTGKAVLLADCAAQHWSATTQSAATNANLVMEPIPAKTTHVYQPADQFVICALKRSLLEPLSCCPKLSLYLQWCCHCLGALAGGTVCR